MNKTLPLTLTLALILSSATAFSSRNAEDGALRYKGYDELIANITPLEYRNNTYFWIDYSRTLIYSGSMLLNKEGKAVKDNNTVLIFSTAKTIHNNYGKDNIQQLKDYSTYFTSIADNEILGIENNSLEISGLYLTTATYLEKSVDSFSPDNTEKYLNYEEKLIEKMNAVYGKERKLRAYETLPAAYPSWKLLRNYQKSLGDILSGMINNRWYLTESGKTLAKEIKSRVNVKEKEPATNPLLIASALIVVVSVVLIKRIKR